MGDKSNKQWLDEKANVGVAKLKQFGQWMADGAKANMQRDLEILEYYANKGDRVHYWNYLAKIPGNDGYGLLALGVVYNDNQPGRTANMNAAKVAAANGVTMTPRKWEDAGKELILQDIKHRKAEFAAGRYENVVNLPVALVEKAHDDMFATAELPPETWTAKDFIRDARQKGGEEYANQLWNAMLNNNWIGIDRALTLGWHQFINTVKSSGSYFASLVSEAPVKNPDQIGDAHYDRQTKRWYLFSKDNSISFNAPGGQIDFAEIKNPQSIENLNQMRQIILERQQMQLHPLDKDGSRILKTPMSLENDKLPRSSEYAAPEAQPGLTNGVPSENAQLVKASANETAKAATNDVAKDPFGTRVDAILETQTAQNDPHAALKAVAQASQERQAGQIQGLDPITSTQGQVQSRS